MTINLDNLRILNTRPSAQAGELSAAITKAGGIVIECPALEIKPITTWFTSSAPLNTAHFAIFISANAVHCCFSVLEKQQIAWPANICVIAIGQGTAKALEKWGIPVDLIPSKADSEHLLSLKELQTIHEKSIILFKGEEGRTLIADTLTARGAKLVIFETYKREKPYFNPQELAKLWRNDLVDIILFTSQQSMQNIFSLFVGDEAQTWLCTKPWLVLSRRLEKAAVLLGIKNVLVSCPEAILETLQQFKKGLKDGQQRCKPRKNNKN